MTKTVKTITVTFCMLALVLVSFSCSRTKPLTKDVRDLCDCGPDTCLKDPRYPAKLAKKKADLKKAEFPDELISLLDRDGNCVMAIDQAPDAFRILLVKANGDNNSIAWSKHDEEIAKQEILKGAIKEYYKYNVRKVFACCTEPKAESRLDWDSTLALSRNLAIVCSLSGRVVSCR